MKGRAYRDGGLCTEISDNKNALEEGGSKKNIPVQRLVENPFVELKSTWTVMTPPPLGPVTARRRGGPRGLSEGSLYHHTSRSLWVTIKYPQRGFQKLFQF